MRWLVRRSKSLGAAALATACAVLLLPVMAHAATTGSITGVVTDASADPLEGIEVCAANANGYGFGGCAETGTDGSYTISDVTPASHKVEFRSSGNYTSQYFDGASDWEGASPVAVTAGSPTIQIDAEMQAGGQITGTVTAAGSNAPLAGVEVCAHGGGPLTPGMYQCQFTEANGEYTIGGLRTGAYTVGFSGVANRLNYVAQYWEGKESGSEADPVSVTVGSTHPGINAALDEGGTIAGTVIAANGKAPLENVEACAYRSGDQELVACGARSDVLGHYEVAGLPTGSYRLSFRPQADSGLELRYYDGKGSLAEADPVSVTAGQPTPNIGVELPELGKISGTVTAAGGGGIANLRICAEPFDYEHGTYGCGTTNSGGEYIIPNLAAGSYKVKFNGGLDYVGQYYDGQESREDADPVVVASAATTGSVNAQLRPAAKLRGKVTAGGSPVGDIEVCAFDVGSDRREPSYECAATATTDAQGEYTLGGLPTSSYKIRFQAGYGEVSPGTYGRLNYVTQYYDGQTSRGAAKAVAATAGGTLTGIDAAMEVGGRITGTVTDSKTGAALEGVEVCPSRAVGQGAEYLECAYSDSNGRYAIGGLPTGSYAVRFIYYGSAGYLQQYYADKEEQQEAEAVAVTAGSTTPGVNAGLHEGGEITGTVTDASGADLEEIDVCAIGGEPGIGGCAYTRADGSYAINGLKAGSYTIEFLPEGRGNYVRQYYSEKSSFEDADPVTVTRGASTGGIDAALAEGGEISGTVTGSGGGPLEGIEVCPIGIDGGPGVDYFEYGQCGVSDSSGDYTIMGLPAGSYKVEFRAGNAPGQEGYARQYYQGKGSADEATPVAVTAKQTAEHVDAVMVEGGKISGRVTDADTGATLEQIQVCVETEAEEYVGCAFTESDGSYTIAGLSSGTYVVRFSAYNGATLQNYLPQFYEGESSFAAAKRVALTAPDVKSGVDAALQAGGQIKGTVTDAATGRDLEGIVVCALEAGGANELYGCATTTGDGHYTLAELPSGSYEVQFSSSFPFGGLEYETQYYDAATSQAAADPVLVTAGATRTSIDAKMVEGNGGSAGKPINEEPPVLSGTPEVGQTLTCSSGRWLGLSSGGGVPPGTPTALSFAFFRDGLPLSGHSLGTYVVQSADEGHSITCAVTVVNAAGSTTALSNAVAIPSRESSKGDEDGGGGGEGSPGNGAPAPVARPARPAAPQAAPSGHAPRSSASAVAGAMAVAQGNGVVVSLRCPGEASCHGVVKLLVEIRPQATTTRSFDRRRAGRKSTILVVGQSKFSVAAGGQATIKVPLTSKGKKLVRQAGRRGLKVKLAGNGIKTRTLTLKPKPRPKHHGRG